jgi:LysM repeat protein
MNILRIFSVVVGIHVVALVLIFANPGCSSPNKSAPSLSTTPSPNDDDSTVVSRADPDANPVVIAGGNSPVSSVPSSFDPDATAAPEIRFSPTRPGTPTATMLEAQPVGDVLPASTYTVVKGDSLWTIAKKHGVSIAEIAAANNIRSNAVIRLGQKLIIPSKSAPAESPVVQRAESPVRAVSTPAPRTSGSPVVHVVRPGETLGAIARKYQVKVGEIAAANSIADPAKIRPGKELVIPGWQAPTGRSAQTPATNPPEGSAPPVEQPAPESTPTLVIPAPETDPSAEPPVIRVEENP